MSSLSELIDQVRMVLLQTEGNKPRHETYNEFINECKTLDLTEEEFYRDVLKPASKSIDWDAIEADKKNKEDEQKRKIEEAAKAEEQRKMVLAQVTRDIQYCIDAGIVEPKELQAIFFKAAAYGINTEELARRIQSDLDNKRFKPYPKPDITLPLLHEKISSTAWYDEAHYLTQTQYNPPPPPLVTTQPQPQKKPVPQAEPSFDTKAKKRSGTTVLILFLFALVVGGYLFLKDANRYSSGDTTADSTAVTDTSTVMRKPAMPTDTSPSNASDSETELSDQEKADIASLLTTFYNYENLENIDGMLSYFSFPVRNYYKIYTDVSYDKLKSIFTKSFSQMSSHHITVDMNQSTVQKTAEGYVVRVYANYQFVTQKVPNGNRDVRIVIYLNGDKRITSIYEL